MNNTYQKIKVNATWVSVVRPEKMMGTLCEKETCKKRKRKSYNEFAVDQCQKNLGMNQTFIFRSEIAPLLQKICTGNTIFTTLYVHMYRLTKN